MHSTGDPGGKLLPKSGRKRQFVIYLTQVAQYLCSDLEQGKVKEDCDRIYTKTSYMLDIVLSSRYWV
jgi:hypothetical protein